MKRHSVLLLGLLPALSAAFVSKYWACLPGYFNNSFTAATDAKLTEIKEQGELAVVARDPAAGEVPSSCVVVYFAPDLTYSLRYKDGAGIRRKIVGSFVEEKAYSAKYQIKEARFYLRNVPKDVFNGGELYPVLVQDSEIILQGCRLGFPSNITTYLLVPLAKAKAGTANVRCCCDDWSKA